MDGQRNIKLLYLSKEQERVRGSRTKLDLGGFKIIETMLAMLETVACLNINSWKPWLDCRLMGSDWKESELIVYLNFNRVIEGIMQRNIEDTVA